MGYSQKSILLDLDKTKGTNAQSSRREDIRGVINEFDILRALKEILRAWLSRPARSGQSS